MLKLTNNCLLYHSSYQEIPLINLEMCTDGLDFGNQYCFRTQKAIKALEFVRSIPYGSR